LKFNGLNKKCNFFYFFCKKSACFVTDVNGRGKSFLFLSVGRDFGPALSAGIGWFIGPEQKTYLNMKKLFLAMGVVAMLAGLSSCSKNCVCKQYMNGELMQTTTVEGKGKCSDLNVKQEVMGMVNETKCENE
jgi:hypothetical protein